MLRLIRYFLGRARNLTRGENDSIRYVALIGYLRGDFRGQTAFEQLRIVSQQVCRIEAICVTSSALTLNLIHHSRKKKRQIFGWYQRHDLLHRGLVRNPITTLGKKKRFKFVDNIFDPFFFSPLHLPVVFELSSAGGKKRKPHDTADRYSKIYILPSLIDVSTNLHIRAVIANFDGGAKERMKIQHPRKCH